MTAADTTSIRAAYEGAMRHQAAGRDDEALRAYGAIIDRNPNIAEVHFQVARLFLRNDRTERAIRHAMAAARLKPAEPDIWVVWADAVAVLSDKAARDRFLKALKASPLDKRRKGDLSAAVAVRGPSRPPLGGMSPAELRSLAEPVDARRFAEAETVARRLVARHPGSAVAHDLLGVALAGLGRLDEAEAAGRAAIAIDPNLPEAHVNLARTLRILKRAPEAVRHCNAALRLAPGLGTALAGRGQCHAEMGQTDEAKADFLRALDAEPGNFEARVALGKILAEDEMDYAAAEAVLRGALDRGHDSATLRQAMGRVLAELGQSEAALEHLARLRELDPGSALGLSRSAELKQSLGRFDEAEAEFREAIAQHPERGELYRIWLTTKKVTLDDPVVAEMERRFRDETQSDETRANLGFALAKVMEDNRAWDRVFGYLHPANALMRTLRPYDADKRRDLSARLLDSFRQTDWQDPSLMSDESFAPIFVTGMPRSGTTLVEQIISSHSTVTGAGEIGVAGRLALKLMGGETAAVRSTATIRRDDYAAVGKAYREYIARHLPGAGIVTDKSIQTYQFLGVLKRALPKARFVVVRRDPRDNLLSIYRNVFPEKAHRYAYDLGELAGQFHQFVETVEYWRDVAPDWLYEVQYEDLVANPEEETRKLIAACGLDWEDACLNFHQSERRVKTLSLYQVRQPMYRSSTRAWERYGSELDGLMTALGPRWTDAAS